MAAVVGAGGEHGMSAFSHRRALHGHVMKHVFGLNGAGDPAKYRAERWDRILARAGLGDCPRAGEARRKLGRTGCALARRAPTPRNICMEECDARADAREIGLVDHGFAAQLKGYERAGAQALDGAIAQGTCFERPAQAAEAVVEGFGLVGGAAVWVVATRRAGGRHVLHTAYRRVQPGPGGRWRPVPLVELRFEVAIERARSLA